MRRPVVMLFAVLAMLGVSGCGGTDDPSQAVAPAGPFAYDRAAPLHYVDRGVVNHDYPIKVHDVSFTAAGRRVDGFLAVPPGKGPFPAVLYLHGSGGDRSQMIVPATILAGVEPRIRAFDLFSGGSPPIEEYARQAPAPLRAAVRRELGAVDPLRWVARARPGTILLQDGRQDEVVPRASLQALAKAAGPAAEVRWYDQSHSPENAAWLDQLRWLSGKLGVGGPVVPGAAAGP